MEFVANSTEPMNSYLDRPISRGVRGLRGPWRVIFVLTDELNLHFVGSVKVSGLFPI